MTTQPNDGLLYLKTCPSAQPFICRCAGCQRLGHMPTKLAEAEIHYNLRQNIQRYFPVMDLNDIGLCVQCAEAQGSTVGTTNT
jgi:hypothetical protein